MILVLKRILYRRRIQRFMNSDRFRNQRVRLMNIQETCSTENTYNRQLGYCIENFKKLALENDIISESDGKVMFSNMEQIWTISNYLLTGLENEANKIPMFTSFGSCFLNIIHFFKLYKVYICNYDRANNHIKKIFKQKPQVREWFNERSNTAPSFCYRYNIFDFQILPIGRLPRYKLLLENIRKRTPTNHLDYDNLNECLNVLVDTCKFFNNSRRENSKRKVLERLGKIMSAEDKFSILDYPHRKFYGYISTRLFCEKKGIVDLMEYIVYLFYDLIIFVNKLSWKSVGGTEKEKADNYIICFFKNVIEIKLVDVGDNELVLVKVGMNGEVYDFFLMLNYHWFEKIVKSKSENDKKVEESMKIINADRNCRFTYLLEQMNDYKVKVILYDTELVCLRIQLFSRVKV